MFIFIYFLSVFGHFALVFVIAELHILVVLYLFVSIFTELHNFEH